MTTYFTWNCFNPCAPSFRIWWPDMATNFEGKYWQNWKCTEIFYTPPLYNEHLSYSDRLDLLKTETSEQTRIKSDLTMFFNVHRKLVELNVTDFSYSNRLRWHNWQLCINFSRTEKRQLFWLSRITSTWNRLTLTAVDCTNTRSFKKWIQTMNFTGRECVYCF